VFKDCSLLGNRGDGWNPIELKGLSCTCAKIIGKAHSDGLRALSGLLSFVRHFFFCGRVRSFGNSLPIL
jgi:hypothetical protein